MKNCLIVDDSSSIRKVARRILQDYDIDTTEADSSRSGLEACRRAMPDCVVVDWHMPDGDGVDFVSRLRAMPGGTRPKVMYCTSENDARLLARARRAGADACLLKPFDRTALLSGLEAVGLFEDEGEDQALSRYSASSGSRRT